MELRRRPRPGRSGVLASAWARAVVCRTPSKKRSSKHSELPALRGSRRDTEGGGGGEAHGICAARPGVARGDRDRGRCAQKSTAASTASAAVQASAEAGAVDGVTGGAAPNLGLGCVAGGGAPDGVVADDEVPFTGVAPQKPSGEAVRQPLPA